MPGCKSLKYIVKIIDPKQYESGTLIFPHVVFMTLYIKKKYNQK
jgi:hypothetical protein